MEENGATGQWLKKEGREMTEKGMTRRRFLTKAAVAAAGFAVLDLGVQCGATPTPEATEVVPTETPVVRETPTPAWAAPERILFVGCGLSGYNDGVETHLTQLAASRDPPLTIEASTAYIPGATFERQWNSSSTLDAVREAGWDVVVLQGQPNTPVLDEQGFYEYARKLDAEIRKAGAHTVFLMLWATSQPGKMAITTESQVKAYDKIGAELGATVAPVGLAWERSLQENPEPDLYDDEHEGWGPSIYGTYLTACVFYATLYGESPAGLSYKPIWITDEEATFLQRIAWETVQEYKQPRAD